MTVHSLHARFDPESELYLYDDTPKGVLNEPLVKSTTHVIKLIFLCHQSICFEEPHPPQIRLDFSPVADDLNHSGDWPIVQLHHRGADAGFQRYGVQGIGPPRFADEWEFLYDMWGSEEVIDLCPHLLDYFDSVPESFFCQLIIR